MSGRRDLHRRHDGIVAMREQPGDQIVPVLRDEAARHGHPAAKLLPQIDLEARELVAFEKIVWWPGTLAGDHKVGRHGGRLGGNLTGRRRREDQCEPGEAQDRQASQLPEHESQILASPPRPRACRSGSIR